MKIITKQRSTDWMAYIKDGVWECGRNELEAIGKLVKTLMAESSDYEIIIVEKEL